MQPACLRHNLIPGASTLFLDYLYHFDRVGKYYAGNPYDADIWPAKAAELRYPDERRRKLVAALTAQGNDRESCERLGRSGTVAVVTGQQVGLYSGPAYTIYKAITAVELARSLEARGIPAVPVFWTATEDHDLAEVDHTWLFDASGQPAQVRASGLESHGGPVGRAVLREQPFPELERLLSGMPAGEAVLEYVKTSFQPGQTLGAAFRQLVSRILGGIKLLYVDPLDPAMREIFSPVLVETLDRSDELVEALRVRDGELAADGYHSQVLVNPQSSLLFLLQDGSRVPVRRKGQNGFAAGEKLLSAEELRARGVELSPNALLRPVVQDYLLPTVAYVGGPSELAYFAQSEVLYRRLLGRMPIMMPRNGFTLVDQRAAKLLAKYQLQIDDLLRSEDGICQEIARTLVPAHVHDAMRGAETALRQTFHSLGSELTIFDPTLAAASRKSLAKMEYQLSKLRGKVEREQFRRDARVTADAAYLTNQFYPHRHLQERFYSILPFLARHGVDLPGRLLEFAQFNCADHMIRIV